MTKNPTTPDIRHGRMLADILDAVAQHSGLSDARRRDLRSAVRTTARLIGKPPETIEADWPALRRRFQAMTPATHGISAKRLQNVRTDLRAALKACGGLSARSWRKRTPAWETLYQSLPTKRFKNGLTGFIRFCSDRDIDPLVVSDATSIQYREYLDTEGPRAKPNDVHRNTCRLWNQAAAEIGGWPQQRLIVPDHRATPWQRDWTGFEPSFRQDVEAHLQWLVGRDLMAAHQPPRYLRMSTITLRKKQIQGLASAAIEAGIPASALGSLEDLVQPESVKAALNFFLHRYQNESTVYIRSLAGTVLAIARHWVRAPDQTLDALRELSRRLGPRTHPGLTEKNRAALRQFDSPENVDLLLQLPGQLARSSARLKSPQRRAVRMQLALAIELLLMAPMRIGNLAALRLDQHLQREGRKTQRVFIVLGDNEVKNAMPLEYPLTGSTVELLDEYLQKHRPHLVSGDDEPWLFPGPGGHHKRAATLSAQVQKIIRQETGLRLTAHQFRHLAAKLYLDANPGAYETVRRVLGQRNLKTTTQFYAGMETRAAVEQYDQLMADKRTKQPVRPKAGVR